MVLKSKMPNIVLTNVLYQMLKDISFRSLRLNYNITVDFIVKGCATLSYESNKYNIISALKFIRDSRIFK